MFGYTERQVVAGAADPHRAAVDPGVAVGAQPRRPAGQRRGRAVEGERDRGHPERQGVDAEVRHGQLRRRLTQRPATRRVDLTDIYHDFKSASYVIDTLGRVTCEKTIVKIFIISGHRRGFLHRCGGCPPATLRATLAKLSSCIST